MWLFYRPMSLASLHYTPGQIADKRALVRRAMLAESPYVRQGNFIRLGDEDVRLLYRLYDRIFFDGRLQTLVMERCGTPVSLRASGKMTSSGGMTTQRRVRRPGGPTQTRYQIAIASRLLFNSFHNPGQPVRVSGQPCVDRLDAMMRIMEHELVHLLEMVIFGSSSCSQTRFMTIASRLFGHCHPRHELVTAHEHAQRTYNVRIGEEVAFKFDGRVLRGTVNRIGVRATVLVPDPKGRPYTDGRRYQRYYVPLGRLIKAADSATAC